MDLPYTLLDAFTDQPFTGNPAAVFNLEAPISDGLMQNIAAELKLSETAFVTHAPGHSTLRWFTPVSEVDLCGHATLATAFALFCDQSSSALEPLVFQSKSGPLTCIRQQDGVTLDFPATPPEPEDTNTDILKALTIDDASYFGRSTFDYLIEVPNESTLIALKPDFAALAAYDTRGFIVTALSDDSDYDFVSRFFAPRHGVDEDPVTGSAHCCLGPYWAERLQKTHFHAAQRSPRGGSLRLALKNDRVLLTGQAVIVGHGRFEL